MRDGQITCTWWEYMLNRLHPTPPPFSNKTIYFLGREEGEMFSYMQLDRSDTMALMLEYLGSILKVFWNSVSIRNIWVLYGIKIWLCEQVVFLDLINWIISLCKHGTLWKWWFHNLHKYIYLDLFMLELPLAPTVCQHFHRIF